MARIWERRTRFNNKGSIYQNTLSNQYGLVNTWDFYNITKSSEVLIQRLQKQNVLDGHTGCVNTLAWNDTGSLLLSGSDDYNLNLYDSCNNFKLLHSIKSGHQANVFSAKFLPCTSDLKIVSCAGDGMLQYNELGTEYGGNYFNCHSGTTYEVLVTSGDPNSFLSCGEDGTVRVFDLRTKTKCHCQECADDILIDARHAVTSVTINPILPYHLAVGCKDSYVRVFDRRTLGTTPDTRSVNRNRGWMPGLFCKFKPSKLKQDSSCRVTSLQYSNDGEDLLVSYCTDYVYLFTVKDEDAKIVDTAEPASSKNGFHNHDNSDGFDRDSSSDALPPVKRLRLRGDWSDTGPQSRPEADEEASPENNLMQRMSELFSRWIEDAMSATMRQVSTSSDEDVDMAVENVDERVAENIPSSTPIFGVFSSTHQSPTSQYGESSNSSLREPAENLPRSTPVFGEFSSTHQSPTSNYGESSNSSLREPAENVPPSTPVFGEFSSTHQSPTSNYDESSNSNLREPTENIPPSSPIIGMFTDNSDQQNSSTNTEVGMEISSGTVSSRNQSSMTNLSNETTPSLHSTCHVDGINNNTFDDKREYQGGEDSPYELDDEFRERLRNAYSQNNRYVHERQSAASKIQTFIRMHRQRQREIERMNATRPHHMYIPQYKCHYKGHRNARTMIKEANFWGDDFILSGSDCGRIFIWDRRTTEVVMLLEGDRHVVNCVQPHPYDPILATSGIDHDIKIWAPLAETPTKPSNIEEIIERNERMLEESRDTITVPAAFVLRMFASLGSIRRNHRRIMEEENE